MSWLPGLQNGRPTDVIHLPHAYHNEQAEEACNTQSGQEIEMWSLSFVLFITCRLSVHVGLAQNRQDNSLNLNLKIKRVRFYLLSCLSRFPPRCAWSLLIVFIFSHKARTLFQMFGFPLYFNFYIYDCHCIEASEVSNRKKQFKWTHLLLKAQSA